LPLTLAGAPAERGAAQARARPALGEAVRAATRQRLDECAAARQTRAVRDYLARQAAFAREQCAPEMAELEAIAAGFGLHWQDLFEVLHASPMADLAAPSDACTAWAAVCNDGGAAVAKNRDVRAELAPLQEVMLHEDPAQAMRSVLCVGSLGAPGAYSSGINRAGLAVVDTAIRSRSYRTGWMRYFAMTRLLWTCATVADALDFLRAVPHTGGGSVVLADARGRVAAVEFPDGTPAVEHARTVSRTNHFTTPGAGAPTRPNDANEANSAARLQYLRMALEGRGVPATAQAVADLMGAHGDADQALCRHGEGREVRTISTALYLTRARELIFAPDNPCRARWRRYSLAA